MGDGTRAINGKLVNEENRRDGRVNPRSPKNNVVRNQPHLGGGEPRPNGHALGRHHRSRYDVVNLDDSGHAVGGES